MSVPEDCPFTKGGEPRSFHAVAKRRKDCQRCGGALPPRAMRWCSQRCEQIWHSNHTWGIARKAALERDKRCVRCGIDGRVPQEARDDYDRRYTEWRRLHPPPFPEEYAKPFDYRVAYNKWRKRMEAEVGTIDAVFRRYQLEVNHIVPLLRKTKGTPTSCNNHLDNLETLCHPCHQVETQAQAAERRNKAKPLPLFDQAS